MVCGEDGVCGLMLMSVCVGGYRLGLDRRLIGPGICQSVEGHHSFLHSPYFPRIYFVFTITKVSLKTVIECDPPPPPPPPR